MESKISIVTVMDLAECIFQPSDWSIINLPDDSSKAHKLSKNLFNMPNTRHISLLLCRHRRKDKLMAMKNLAAFSSWVFMDHVSIVYEKPSTASSNGLLPVSEHGYIVYKGDSPNADKTAWFDGEYKNATNNWALGVQEIESEFFKSTYYQKFSWELQLLMYSLVGVREYARFIYGLPISETELRSLFLFCKHYQMSCDLIISGDDKEQKKIKYEQLLKSFAER